MTGRGVPSGCLLALMLLVAAQPALGQPDLGPEELVQAGVSYLHVAGYSVPSLTRWDGDALEDLIVGEGGDGVVEARVRVYPNNGSLTSPQFDTFFYAQSEGRDLIVPGGG